jgi:D-alanyl-D-alanine carboxypeptidase
LVGGRLLRPDLLRAMQTTVRMSPGESYGLGLWRTSNLAISTTFRLPCGPVWGHNGSVPGYAANAFASKDGKRQVIVLANTDVSTPRLRQALGKLIATAYCG